MRILLSTLAPLLVLSAHAAQTATNLDLIHATIDDRPIAQLTVDSVTDMFGRPTAVKQPEILGGAGEHAFRSGVILVYAELGLRFRFHHEQDDSKQGIANMVVYLSRKEDPETRTECSPFHGAITSGVTADWKAKRVMQDFAQYKPVDWYDQAHKKREEDDAWDQLDRLAGRPIIPHANFFFIIVGFPKCVVHFYYEENTRFLEYLEVSR